MNKLKYLNEEAIDLNEIVGKNQNVNKVVSLGDISMHITTTFELETFMLHIGKSRNNTIPCRRSSKCEVRKVDNGIFKGCYCVTEQGSTVFHAGKEDYTVIYVVHNDGKILLLDKNVGLSLNQIDERFDRKHIENLTAKMLNCYDLTLDANKKQKYKNFCESLPDSVLTDSKFFDNVCTKFFALGAMKFDPPINKNYLWLVQGVAKKEAYEYFNDLVKSKKSESENEI